MQPELASKRFELLREVVPNIRRLAIMVNPGFRDVVLEANEVQALAQPLGIEVATLKIWRAEEVMPTLESLKDPPDALYVPSDATFNSNRIPINTFALNARLPTMHGFREFVEAGGLMRQITQACSGALPNTWTRFCAGQSLLTCRLSSRPSSISSLT